MARTWSWRVANGSRRCHRRCGRLGPLSDWTAKRFVGDRKDLQVQNVVYLAHVVSSHNFEIAAWWSFAVPAMSLCQGVDHWDIDDMALREGSTAGEVGPSPQNVELNGLLSHLGTVPESLAGTTIAPM